MATLAEVSKPIEQRQSPSQCARAWQRIRSYLDAWPATLPRMGASVIVCIVPMTEAVMLEVWIAYHHRHPLLASADLGARPR